MGWRQTRPWSINPSVSRTWFLAEYPIFTARTPGSPGYRAPRRSWGALLGLSTPAPCPLPFCICSSGAQSRGWGASVGPLSAQVPAHSRLTVNIPQTSK